MNAQKNGLRLAHLWALLPVVLVFVAVSTDPSHWADFWHHLAAGEVMAQTGRIVDRDVFTYTVAGQKFLNGNWLAQLFYCAMHQIGGLKMNVFANALLLSAMMAIVVRAAQRECGSWRAAGMAGVFVFFLLWQNLSLRTQSFAFLLFAAMYASLIAAETRPKWLAAPPLAVALWANLHGSFPLGVMLAGVFFVARMIEQRKWDALAVKMGVCLAACAVAWMANPYGFALWKYVSGTSAVATARGIMEWKPVDLDLLMGKMLAASIVVLLLLVATGKARLRVREMILIAVFLPLSFRAVRMASWWGIVLAPILARQVAAWWRQADSRQESRALNFAVAGVLAAMTVFSTPWLKQHNVVLAAAKRFDSEPEIPRAVLEFLETDDRGGRLFTRFEWGEYLEWRLRGRFLVFMDARIEIFPPEVWQDYVRISAGHASWDEILRRYDVDWLLLQTNYHDALVPLAQASPRWTNLFASGDAVLFGRRQ